MHGMPHAIIAQSMNSTSMRAKSLAMLAPIVVQLESARCRRQEARLSAMIVSSSAPT